MTSATQGKIKHIAIIAGEASGDILGSRLIASLKQHNPNITFEGIGGKEMVGQGCNCLYPMEKLAVMGFTEVLKRLPELLKIRYQLINRWKLSKPDLVIGIDAPDFNLKLEAKLHQAGIKVAHYVSPSVWAWRSKRVKKMKGNMDLMLTLFPFEADFYRHHNIPVEFVGHPLADEIAINDTPEARLSDKQRARESLSLPAEGTILAILPGSRGSEINYLAEVFIGTAKQLQNENTELILVVPMTNQCLMERFNQLRKEMAPDVKITMLIGHSRKVMAAADYILMASGTATLEGMFVGRPMVAAGKLSPITAWLVRNLFGLNVDYYTLPNNLAKEALVTELIQEDVSVDNLVLAVNAMINMDKEKKRYILKRFSELHENLRKDASATTAKILVERFDLV